MRTVWIPDAPTWNRWVTDGFGLGVTVGIRADPGGYTVCVTVGEAYMGYMWDACTDAHRRVPKGNVLAGATGTLVLLRVGVCNNPGSQ